MRDTTKKCFPTWYYDLTPSQQKYVRKHKKELNKCTNDDSQRIQIINEGILKNEIKETTDILRCINKKLHGHLCQDCSYLIKTIQKFMEYSEDKDVNTQSETILNTFRTETYNYVLDRQKWITEMYSFLEENKYLNDSLSNIRDNCQQNYFIQRHFIQRQLPSSSSLSFSPLYSSLSNKQQRIDASTANQNRLHEKIKKTPKELESTQKKL